MNRYPKHLRKSLPQKMTPKYLGEKTTKQKKTEKVVQKENFKSNF